jgi:hypothetical protein
MLRKSSIPESGFFIMEVHLRKQIKRITYPKRFTDIISHFFIGGASWSRKNQRKNVQNVAAKKSSPEPVSVTANGGDLKLMTIGTSANALQTYRVQPVTARDSLKNKWTGVDFKRIGRSMVWQRT